MPIQTPQWTEFLQCPICYNEFDNHDRQPISLGCGHTLCVSCLSKLSKTQCPFDQASVETDITKLPYNYALLQLVGVEIPDNGLPPIDSVKENATYFKKSISCIEKLALFLKPVNGTVNGTVNGNVNGSTCNGSVNSNGNNILTRPMQRKLVTLVNCQLAEGDGRTRAMRAARSLGERTVTELILLHQNQQQLSANLWAAVRNRGCQFLGPAMQEEALKLILLALEGGEALSRKVLVLFVVQKLESQFPQASKTSIGHVVQLLYRASCFKVEKKNNESSLMQLKEQYRTYDALRKEHDAQIVQIATEAGLRILPDQWSSLLYGDMDHKSHMQSIIDKLQTPASFSQSIQELIIALQRSGDPGNLCQMRDQFELLSQIDASPEASCPAWDELEQAMVSVHSVVHGLVDFSKSHGRGMKGSGDPPQSHNNKFKTSMCRDHTRGGCPRGPHCTFAHSEEELEKFGRRRAPRPRPSPIARGPGPSVAPDQFSPLENGCDGSPTATQAPTNGVNGSARSSPLYISPGDVPQSTNCYVPQAQMGRRDSQEQILAHRMKQVSLHPNDPQYPNGFCGQRPAYDHYVSSPGRERQQFFPYYTPSAGHPGGSYSSVVSRGKDVPVGVMTPPRSSPLTVQDEGSGLNGMVNGMANGLANGMTNGMPNGLSNGISNGHIDHHVGRVDHPSLYNGRHRTRPLQPQPGSYHTYDHSYGGFPSDPTYYSAPPDYYTSHYSGRQLSSYEQVHGVMGYPYTQRGDYYPHSRIIDYPETIMHRGILLPQGRSPYIPSDIGDDKNDILSQRKSDATLDFDPSEVWRKDNDSGVSCGSPLSHSPAASQSSNSSLSPRQQSPVGWQHGNDATDIWRNINEDSNGFPSSLTITDSTQIWSPPRGNEHSQVRKLWHPLYDLNDEWSSQEEQIKKDEQYARALQEQLKQGETTTPPETRGSELPSQGRDPQDVPDRGLTIDNLETEAEMKRRKHEEHRRLLQERRQLLQQQEREKQERDDRKLAEELALRDAQQAGIVPDPRCIVKPSFANVISRGAPMGLGFSGKGSDIPGEHDPFRGLSSYRSSCASSWTSSDDVMDASKVTSGCNGDIRVQE
ncbi:unnamed protein product [Pocillopora meandrina]|uniref:RING-type E3 ubiquitin transferase n=1 Tax=Pocillopora meandrina TaxID=46732 RepID=A0AAU9VW24_9CNID|nr:unnamed protein product [Pocillopora meandrina]